LRRHATIRAQDSRARERNSLLGDRLEGHDLISLGTDDDRTGTKMTKLTNQGVTGQRMRALERANQLRRARAALKRQVARGQVAAADVILTCPDEATHMPICQLLASQRGWGEVRCRAFLNRISLREDKPVGSLTERQRLAIASLLPGPNRGSDLN